MCLWFGTSLDCLTIKNVELCPECGIARFQVILKLFLMKSCMLVQVPKSSAPFQITVKKILHVINNYFDNCLLNKNNILRLFSSEILVTQLYVDSRSAFRLLKVILPSVDEILI